MSHLHTSWDADLEVQVSLIQVVQSDFLQPGPLQLRQALDGHRLQPHTLTQHVGPGVVPLQGAKDGLVITEKDF